MTKDCDGNELNVGDLVESAYSLRLEKTAPPDQRGWFCHLWSVPARITQIRGPFVYVERTDHSAPMHCAELVRKVIP